MPDDPEVRELRERVRNLESQLAFARRGGGGAGGGGGGGGSVAIAGIAGVAVLFVIAGAGAFVLTRGQGAERVELDEAGRQERDARAQADSRAQVAAVLQEELAVANSAREVAARDPQYVEADAVYDARVTAVTGASHVHVGDACRVDIAWTTDPGRNCRALVDCGTHRLYGDVGQGWFPCRATADEGLLHGEDDVPTSEDGDPRITIDRVAGSLTLGDDAPTWTATLSISATPEVAHL